ncbi:MAG TPA: response regulator transcription factor [Tepidisphaeraceae bacterium]
MAIRVLLADDHELFRQGVRSVLVGNPDVQVVAEASDGEEAVNKAKEADADVVILDIGMPKLNGIEAARQIRAGGRTRVIALSVHGEGVIVRRMLEAGASAYLLKDCASDEVNQALETVMRGEVYLGKGLGDVIVKQLGSPTGTPLSRREQDVLRHIAEGLTTKEIARVLGVSPKTVDTHRQHLMTKLDIHSIAELTKYALRLGLTALENNPEIAKLRSREPGDEQLEE